MVKKYHHGWIDSTATVSSTHPGSDANPRCKNLDCHETHLVIDTFLLITCSSTIIGCSRVGTTVDQQQGSGEDQPDPLPGRSRAQHPRDAGRKEHLPHLCNPYAR